MNEKIKQKFIKAKEENDYITIIHLAREYPIPSEMRKDLYEVCFLSLYYLILFILFDRKKLKFTKKE